MGSDEGVDELVQASRDQAHEIKRQIEVDGKRTRKHMDTLDKKTNIKLNKISADLKTVTYKIWLAQDGERRVR